MRTRKPNGIDRVEAERIARLSPLPAFRYADIWRRRGKRYVIVRGRLIGRKHGRPQIRLLSPTGCVLETEAALFFVDPRWPARRVGRDRTLAKRAALAATALAAGRAANSVATRQEGAGEADQERKEPDTVTKGGRYAEDGKGESRL